MFQVAHIVPRKEPTGWRTGEVRALPELCEQVKNQRLVLCRSDELIGEEMGGTQTGQGLVGDLVGTITFRDALSPIERSRFMSLPLGIYNSSSCRNSFLKLLLEAYQRGELQNIRKWPLTPFELDSIERFDRFADICSCLEESQFADGWHLWTAERNGVDFFLTLDKRFVNVMTRTSRVPLISLPVFPSELVEILRMKERAAIG
ncbi:type II toxin-antitoxin system VapC family toxin [Luteimonas yindakuii]|uniref:type II toxin-antitoxin system VapC family toxin n=1 Tax=Luteimonas yindakuii TaxID=2565782 RepID=UPI0010A54350|nr:type II toxin-antitoxin system VapC family toxin [Luteimonas yindakuii]QCO66848.1 type II toxin-antitoxin system VapC family toxin [Luteimonas yindakuii]